jgi:hypothetical protein
VRVSLTERECLFFISMTVIMRNVLILSCLSVNMKFVQNSAFFVVWFGLETCHSVSGVK